MRNNGEITAHCINNSVLRKGFYDQNGMRCLHFTYEAVTRADSVKRKEYLPKGILNFTPGKMAPPI
jgi:hypothetical protein